MKDSVPHEEWWSLRMGLHLCFRHRWVARGRHLQPGTAVSSPWRFPGTLTSPGFCQCSDYRSRPWVTLLEKVKKLNLMNCLTSWAEEEPWGKKSFGPVPSVIFAEIGAVQEQAVGTTLCQRVCHTNTNSSLWSSQLAVVLWPKCFKDSDFAKGSFGKQIPLLLNLRN